MAWRYDRRFDAFYCKIDIRKKTFKNIVKKNISELVIK